MNGTLSRNPLPKTGTTEFYLLDAEIYKQLLHSKRIQVDFTASDSPDKLKMDSLEAMDNKVQQLREQVEVTESQLRSLKIQLQQAKVETEAARNVEQAYRGGFPAAWIDETLSALYQDPGMDIFPYTLNDYTSATPQRASRRWPLADDEYKRYGRQLIMPEVGQHGQLRLKTAKVLIVGVGGLGCPAAAYLAGAGIGTLGLMDGDTVELSNLHRQIAHASTRVGLSKVESAWEYLHSYVDDVLIVQSHSSDRSL